MVNWWWWRTLKNSIRWEEWSKDVDDDDDGDGDEDADSGGGIVDGDGGGDAHWEEWSKLYGSQTLISALPMLKIITLRYLQVFLSTITIIPERWHHRHHKCRSSSSPRPPLLASQKGNQSLVCHNLGRPEIKICDIGYFEHCCIAENSFVVLHYTFMAELCISGGRVGPYLRGKDAS